MQAASAGFWSFNPLLDRRLRDANVTRARKILFARTRESLLALVSTQGIKPMLAIASPVVYYLVTVVDGPESHLMISVGTETGFPQISN